MQHKSLRCRRDRTVYGCGNCQLTFKSEAARAAHLDEHGVCPQVTWERKNAEHNTEMRLQFFLDEVLPEDRAALKEAVADLTAGRVFSLREVVAELEEQGL